MSKRQIQHSLIHLKSMYWLQTDQNWSTIWLYILPTFSRISEYSELECTHKDHLMCYSLIAAEKICIQHTVYGYTVVVFVGCFLILFTYLRDNETPSVKEN